MPDISVEEAVDQSCGALMAGDIMRLMTDFTPEALAGLMAVAAGISAVPALNGYEVQSHEVRGDEHVFGIAFKTSDGDVAVNATWKDVEGLWKITALTIEGLSGVNAGP